MTETEDLRTARAQAAAERDATQRRLTRLKGGAVAAGVAALGGLTWQAAAATHSDGPETILLTTESDGGPRLHDAPSPPQHHREVHRVVSRRDGKHIVVTTPSADRRDTPSAMSEHTPPPSTSHDDAYTFPTTAPS